MSTHAPLCNLGAAAGFKVGLALLEWLGLGFLLAWVASSVTRIGTAFARFFSTVCSAQGDHHKLEQAALELAEAIGVCAGVFVEALVMWATAKGVNVALAQLKGTPFAKALGESRLGTWLQERVSQYKEGDTKLPGPRETLVRVQAPELAKELGIAGSEAEALLRMADFETISSLREYLGPSGFKLLLGKPRAIRETFFQALKQVGADGVARASLLEGLRLNVKGTLSNAHLQSALNAYLAFLKRHGQRVSGDFMSRFWRASAQDKAQALAELRLVDDILAGRTPLGPARRVKGVPANNTSKTPEFQTELSSGMRLVECKTIGEPGKPLSLNTVRNNVGDANSQLKNFARNGEVDGLIRLDAREAGNTNVSATQLADWVSSRIPNPRDNRATRWVEIFYRNAHGQIVRVVLELRSSRFEVYSTQAVR